MNTSADPARADLMIEGTVTVFDGFATFNEPIRVQVGSRRLDLQPQKNGIATDRHAQLRVTNVDEYGIVRGGLMKFELLLKGADWMREVEGAARPPIAGQGVSGSERTSDAAPVLILSLDVARGHHVARHAIARRTQAE